jgi:hypothetical protein
MAAAVERGTINLRRIGNDSLISRLCFLKQLYIARTEMNFKWCATDDD